MNADTPMKSGSAERHSDFLKSLVEFTKDHRAARWSGTLVRVSRERSSPPTPRAITRSSHQYIWDMLRANGFDDVNRPFPLPAVRGRALRHRRHDRARGRLLQGRERRLGSRHAACCCCSGRPRAASRAWSSCSSAASRNTATPTPARCTRSTAARCTNRRCTSSRTRCGRSSARPTASRSPASSARSAPRRLQQRSSQRRLHADAGAADLHLRSRPRRRRHLRAARSDHRRHRRPRRLGRPFQGLGVRRRGRPARLVLVGRGVSPRAAACSR